MLPSFKFFKLGVQVTLIRAVVPMRKHNSRPCGAPPAEKGTVSKGLPFSAYTHPPLSLHIKGPSIREQACQWQLLSLTACSPNFSPYWPWLKGGGRGQWIKPSIQSVPQFRIPTPGWKAAQMLHSSWYPLWLPQLPVFLLAHCTLSQAVACLLKHPVCVSVIAPLCNSCAWPGYESN